jgi:hypothetical protein
MVIYVVFNGVKGYVSLYCMEEMLVVYVGCMLAAAGFLGTSLGNGQYRNFGERGIQVSGSKHGIPGSVNYDGRCRDGSEGMERFRVVRA